MDDVERIRDGWDGMVRTLTDEGLLLAEMTHRTASELAAAIAAVRVAAIAGPTGRTGLLDTAIGRLEAFAVVMDVLNTPPRQAVEVGTALQIVVEGLCVGRPDIANSLLKIDLPQVRMEAKAAQRLLMVTAELVRNAIRHALECREGKLAVILRKERGHVRLTVADDGPGFQLATQPVGFGMGGSIAKELVNRMGGTFHCESGPVGARILVTLPLSVPRSLPHG